MKILHLDQDTDDWHKRRAISIGSSDAPAIMRSCPYKQYEDLLAEKRGERKKTFVSNHAMELGKKWEGSAREIFNMLHDTDLKPLVGQHDEHEFLIASFDGICLEKNCFIEIKYVGLKKLKQIEQSQEPFYNHWIQMQHQFLVSGMPRAFYVAYDLQSDESGIRTCLTQEVKRDDNFISELLLNEKAFWEKCK